MPRASDELVYIRLAQSRDPAAEPPALSLSDASELIAWSLLMVEQVNWVGINDEAFASDEAEVVMIGSRTNICRGALVLMADRSRTQ